MVSRMFSIDHYCNFFAFELPVNSRSIKYIRRRKFFQKILRDYEACSIHISKLPKKAIFSVSRFLFPKTTTLLTLCSLRAIRIPSRKGNLLAPPGGGDLAQC